MLPRYYHNANTTTNIAVTNPARPSAVHYATGADSHTRNPMHPHYNPFASSTNRFTYTRAGPALGSSSSSSRPNFSTATPRQNIMMSHSQYGPARTIAAPVRSLVSHRGPVMVSSSRSNTFHTPRHSTTRPSTHSHSHSTSTSTSTALVVNGVGPGFQRPPSSFRSQVVEQHKQSARMVNTPARRADNRRAPHNFTSRISGLSTATPEQVQRTPQPGRTTHRHTIRPQTHTAQKQCWHAQRCRSVRDHRHQICD